MPQVGPKQQTIRPFDKTCILNNNRVFWDAYIYSLSQMCNCLVLYKATIKSQRTRYKWARTNRSFVVQLFLCYLIVLEMSWKITFPWLWEPCVMYLLSDFYSVPCQVILFSVRCQIIFLYAVSCHILFVLCHILISNHFHYCHDFSWTSAGTTIETSCYGTLSMCSFKSQTHQRLSQKGVLYPS